MSSRILTVLVPLACLCTMGAAVSVLVLAAPGPVEAGSTASTLTSSPALTGDTGTLTRSCREGDDCVYSWQEDTLTFSVPAE